MSYVRTLFNLALCLSVVGAAHLSLEAGAPGMVVSVCIVMWFIKIWVRDEQKS